MEDDNGSVRLLSVVGLRVGGLLCQLLIVAMEIVLLGTAAGALRLPIAVMGLGTLLSGALWLRGQYRSLSSTTFTLAIVADIVVLTVVLAGTGGPHNPFTFFYVIHVATAVVVVDRPRAWSVAAAAALGFLVLFLLPADHHLLHDPTRMNLHMRGMWLAFVVTACFVVLFVGQLRATLDARTRDQARLRALAERSDRLAALATLAGGAAHELATPLSTIAVVADDLALRLKHADAEVVADVALIAAEVRRCREVLNHLAADAGTPAGEASVDVSLRALLDSALHELGTARAALVDVALGDLDTYTLHVPRRAFTQALRGLLKNASEAGATAITVRADVADRTVRVVVVDNGSGFAADVLARVGEPFMTTKAPGAGMGLGLFLTRTLVERFGGSVTIGSAEHGPGAQVTLVLPMEKA
jgi:two-component system sensor histidine kinase RegB